MSKAVNRLFREFVPTNYDLSLAIDKNSMSFSGTVTITGVKSGRPSHRLTFHQKQLVISSVSVVKQDKTGDHTITLDRINTHNKYDEVRLHSKEMIYPGKYQVKLDFSGDITTKMHGLYPCNFTDKNESKIILATQFESHHAREVFPCIDEPEAKATFDLTISTAIGEQILGNTPIKSQKFTKDQSITKFDTTPIMSTYLLAFVIGDIHCVDSKTKDGVIVKTWASTAQPKTSMEFANKEAVAALEFFTEYFQTPFPLSKLDQIALPDFESGAMENWGVVTYREIALLTDPTNRSLSSEQYVAMVVAHELSHQWFGNLVTMKWWDDLWLNESFASIMEHIALDAIHPDWNQWELYTATDVITSSNRDVFSDVQPVGVAVNHPDEIGTLFDPAIVYAKGGRLIKMLREFLGEDVFREGIKIYFDKHSYSNTTREDLWSALSQASNMNIHDIMTPWLEQSGMPLVSIEQTKDGIFAIQDRFLLDEKSSTNLWPIPVLSNNIEPKLLTKHRTKLLVEGDAILNKNGSGHFVVNYNSTDLKNTIAKLFTKHELSSELRVTHLNDLLLLNRRGDTSLVDTLNVVAASSDEPRDAVWLLMSRTVSLAYTIIEGDDTAHNNLNKFKISVAEKLFKELGWDESKSEDPNTKLLRVTLLSWILSSEDNDAQQEARKRFKLVDTIEKLNSDQRSLILSTLIKLEPNKYLDDFVLQYKSTKNPEVQIAIASGLTSIKDIKLGQKLIIEALGDGKSGFVRSQDLFRWYAYLMRNRHLREITWGWFVANWDRLYDEFNDSKSMDYFVNYSASSLNTAEWQKKFQEFFQPKSEIISLKRAIKISSAEIQARVKWRDRDESKVKSFLAGHQ